MTSPDEGAQAGARGALASARALAVLDGETVVTGGEAVTGHDCASCAGHHDQNPAGKIDHCATCASECHYWCCSFAADPAKGGGGSDGSYIVMYPGEWDAAVKAGWQMSNIEVLEHDDYGGLRYTTPHRRCCQEPGAFSVAQRGFYKSFECRVYPLWPYLDEHDEWQFNVSTRCPIYTRGLSLEAKRLEVLEEVREIVARNPLAKRWFRQVRCGGVYVPYVAQA